MRLQVMKSVKINKTIFRLMIVFFLSSPNVGQAKTILVGPDFTFTQPSAALKQAKNGDTIKIFAGIYQNDYAIIRQNNLTIEGVNGFAHLISTSRIPNRKAIWVITGENITIRNIEFSGAKVPDRNGAGIRLEKGSLTLDNCYFHHNEMGILTSNNQDISLSIKNSEFSRNIQDYSITGNLSHNIYVGTIAHFILENSVSRGTQYGHLVKSRAQKTIIRNNRLFDEGDISSSYQIDLPIGGKAIIENNYFFKNKGAQNNALISYGSEGMKYKDNSLTIKYNSAIKDQGQAILLRNHSAIKVKIFGNNLTNISAEPDQRADKNNFWLKIKNILQDLLK